MNRWQDKVIERFIGVVTSLIVALVSFLVFSYFSSFASKAELTYLENSTQSKLRQLEHSLDKVLSGLCIIDPRTCKLKEK